MGVGKMVASVDGWFEGFDWSHHRPVWAGA